MSDQPLQPISATRTDDADLVSLILNAREDVTALVRRAPPDLAHQLLKILKPGLRLFGYGGLFGEKLSAPQRVNALRALQLLEVPVEVPPLVRFLGDRSPAVRAEAAHAIGQMGMWLPWASQEMRQVIGALKLALHHREDANVRRIAAYRLGKMSAWEAQDALIKRLETETDEAVREEVALSLGRMQRANNVFTLIDAYEGSEIDAEVCFAALLRLEEAAIEPLISVLSRWNVPLSSRIMAADALAALRALGAVEPMLTIIERPHEPDEIRVAVAGALAAIGDAGAVPLLEDLTRRPEIPGPVLAAVEEALLALLGSTGQRRLL